MTKKEQSLSELGVYGLINHINKKCQIVNESTILGIGDDASVVDLHKNQLVGTSLFLEGIHFDLVYHPLQHLGYKAVIAAMVDLFAMNGTPSQLMVNLGVSNKMTLERVDLFMEGVFTACKEFGVDLVGFRPMASLTGLSISVTVTGSVKTEDLVLRSTAKPTNLICVTGDLGGALLGLHFLEREKRVLKNETELKPDFGNNDYVLKKQLKPEISLSVFDFLKTHQILPTSMVAIREGLATSALLMCEASKVGCRIYENKIPLNQNTLKAADELNFNPLVAALNGGEDYEFLFTISLTDFEKFGAQFPEDLSVVGYVCEADKGARLITGSDQEVNITAQGWGTK